MSQICKSKIWLMLLIACLSGCIMNISEEKNIFIGDSFVYNWDLKYFFPFAHCENQGIRGDKIAGATYRAAAIDSLSCKSVIIIIGTNDCLSQLAFGKSIDTIFNNVVLEYQGLLDVLGPKNAQCYLFSLFPIADGYTSTSNDFKVLYPRINSELEKRTKNYKNIHFIKVYDELSNKDGFIKGEYCLDGLHLNNLAYSVLCSEIRNYVQ